MELSRAIACALRWVVFRQSHDSQSISRWSPPAHCGQPRVGEAIALIPVAVEIVHLSPRYGTVSPEADDPRTCAEQVHLGPRANGA